MTDYRMKPGDLPAKGYGNSRQFTERPLGGAGERFKAFADPPEILVVDDEPENLRLVKKVLGQEGYCLRFAPNGQMALASIKSRIPDLVLLDIMMPDMDGYEVCKKIKSQPAAEDIPVIHLTALRETHNLVESFKSGAVDFISKPFDNEVLKVRVFTHLTLHKLRKDLGILNRDLDKKVKARTREILQLLDFQRAIVDSAGYAILITDQDLKITSANGSAQKLFRQQESFFKDLDLNALFPQNIVIRLGEMEETLFGSTATSFRQAKAVLDNSVVKCVGFFESVIEITAGVTVTVEGSLATFSGDFEQPSSIVVILNDISRRKLAEAKIEYNAFHDFLTDLPNRRLFLDRLSRVMEGLRRSGSIGAILFVDLDDFKLINDSHGHSVGDLVLKEMARRLRNSLSSGEVISRFGGDEFIILLTDLGRDQEQALQQVNMVGEKLLAAGAQIFKVAGVEFQTTTSVGIRLFSSGDINNNLQVDDIIRQADMALYKAKDSGKNSCYFFSEEMQRHSEKKMQMIHELYAAMREEDFCLYYQPIVDIQRKPVRAECLIRWFNKDGTLVSPAEFIPLAEASGQILPISQWVFEESTRQLMAWRQSSLDMLQSISVNISARQFSRPSFFDDLEQLRLLRGFEPEQLILEITESVVMSDTNRAVKTLSRLNETGYRIALDDFGTGYSSLSYLKDLPIDELKIDRSFIWNINSNPDNKILVEAICTMADQLGLDIIAEGIETEEQFSCLQQHGCHYFQGFLFARPLPRQDFEELVRTAILD